MYLKTPAVAFFISLIVTTTTIFFIFFAKDIVLNLIPRPRATVQTTDVSYIDTFTVISSVVKNDTEYLLVDTRDTKSYQKAHIKNSINISSASILQSKYDKNSLRNQSGDRILVVLSYSMFSTDGELVVEKLMKDGFKPFVLKAGWNEIFNLPNMWVAENNQKLFSDQKSYINFEE